MWLGDKAQEELCVDTNCMKYNGFKINQKNNLPKVWQDDEDKILPQRRGENKVFNSFSSLFINVFSSVVKRKNKTPFIQQN